MIGPEPPCMACRHIFPEKLGEFGFKCRAFPAGIPDEIITEGIQHTEPYPGDNGIRFEPKT